MGSQGQKRRWVYGVCEVCVTACLWLFSVYWSVKCALYGVLCSPTSMYLFLPMSVPPLVPCLVPSTKLTYLLILSTIIIATNIPYYPPYYSQSSKQNIDST
jgi:hypothetical protein